MTDAKELESRAFVAKYVSKSTQVPRVLPLETERGHSLR